MHMIYMPTQINSSNDTDNFEDGRSEDDRILILFVSH